MVIVTVAFFVTLFLNWCVLLLNAVIIFAAQSLKTSIQ